MLSRKEVIMSKLFYFLLTSEKGFSLKDNGEQYMFCHFGVDPFLEGTCCSGRHKMSHFQNWRKPNECIQSLLHEGSNHIAQYKELFFQPKFDDI